MSLPPDPTAPAASPGGVIHDIGYRRYDGPRLGRRHVLASLFVASLRSTYGLGRSAKAKVLPFLLLTTMLLPALIVVAVMIYVRLPNLPLPYERYAIVTQALTGIFVAAQAPQLFSRDLRYRTISLYFCRPLTRLDYVVARFAALAASLAILMLAPLLLLYVGALFAKLPAGDHTTELAKAAVGVLVLALVLAGLGSLIASFTSRRGFGVAAIIAVLLTSYTGVTIAMGITSFADHDVLAGYLGLLSPFTLVDGLQVVVFDAESSSVAAPPDGAVAVLAYVGAAVGFIAGSFGLLVHRYRRVAAA